MRASALLVLLLAACNGPRNGTETGNPNLEVTARIAGGSFSSDPVEVSAGPGGRLTVDRAWAWFEDLRFEDDCTDDEELDTEPFVAELVSGGLVTRKLKSGPYCGVRLDLDSPSDPPATAPPDLGGATFVIEGTIEDGTPYRIVSGEGLSARLDGDFTIDANARDFALGFDVWVWFDGIDPAGLPLEDGVLTLDEQTDPSALEQFETNFEDSVALFTDADGNGQLDDGETTNPLAEPAN